LKITPMNADATGNTRKKTGQMDDDSTDIEKGIS
jgi:hypothetical protein